MIHYNMVHDIIKNNNKRSRLLYTLSLVLLMLTSGAGSLFAQTTDYSGLYYIGTVGYNPANPANNYYLCPTEGWLYYKATNSWSADGASYPNPFLTTYKCKTNDYHGGDASEAVWIITKHPSEDYYYIRHKSDGKYIVANGQISNTTNANRMRVHLEAIAENDLDDKALFKIEPYSNYLVISAKSSDGWNGDNYKWFTVNGGNYDGLDAGPSKKDGPTGNKNTGGIIGIYTQDDGNAKFYLESAIPLPVISFNAQDQIEINVPGDEGDIYYTTDGTVPTAQSTHYTAPFAPVPDANGGITINAIVVMEGDASNKVTFTSPVLCGTDYSRLIQSQNNAWDNTHLHFYMIPGDVSNDVKNVNTTSMFRPTMEWYFKSAGFESGVQYYHVINKSSGEYLSTVGNAVQMKAFDENSANDFKFSIIESPTAGTYNIKPYSSNNVLNKNTNNADPKVIYLNQSRTDANSRWRFVSKTALESTAPFTVSDGNSTTYYRLQNSSNDVYYIKSPAAAGGYATMVADASAGQDTYWYLEQAAAATDADWLEYFYIRNALTGEYLYYANDNPSNSSAAFKTTESNGDAGRYQFTWVRSTTQDKYFIVPRMLRDESLGNISSMNRNNTQLRVQKVRATGASAWSFVPVDFCHDPVINQAANGDITITTTTSGVDIYYTLDGTDPVVPDTGEDPQIPTVKYNGTFAPAIGAATIKAIAVIATNHDVQSNVVEFQFGQYTSPVITFNGINQATITAAEGAAIYYTTDGTDPIVSGSSTNNIEIPISAAVTINAVAAHTGFLTSPVATLEIQKVATPTSTLTDNILTLSCSTEGATLYYTLNGNTPNTSSTQYTGPISAGISNVTVKVLAVKANMLNSDIYTINPVQLTCATPTFRKVDNNTVILLSTSPTDGVTYHYTISSSVSGEDPAEPDNPNISSPSGSTIDISGLTLPIIIKAIATAPGYTQSTVARRKLGTDLIQDDDDAYIINTPDDYELFTEKLRESPEYALASYRIKQNLSLPGNVTIQTVFGGSLEAAINPETNMPYTISGLSNPLFNTLDGGTVKNLILTGVNISGNSGNTGAIAANATGASRIYNVGILDGQVGGSGHTGGLVGDIDGNARVINCFSYANITAGTDKGGIVGYNNVATTATTVQTGTMVMNCMFYGDISQGGNISPVFGGVNISNLENGLNTFNYYLYESPFSSEGYTTAYNSAISVKAENLNHYERYRELLNSNRKLAAIYATGGPQDAENKMLKWVLETADRTIQNPKPYPILKLQGYYPSVINYDPRNREDYTQESDRNQGLKLGQLSVTISGVGTNAPSGANITKSTLTLDRTDKDYAHFNYNYDKVQLPYYNEVGTGNYTHNKVVTGWKITAITAVEDDPYTAANYDYSKNPSVAADKSYFDNTANFNFADRKSSNKDLYSVSRRVFAQGAYFDVPYGVISITIEPYWGNAAYIADATYDVVYPTTGSKGYSRDIVEELGTQATDNTSVLINGDLQTVYKTISTALGTLNGSSVYDNALVLIGNVHLENVPSSESKAFTMMSADLDNDNEPDHSLIYHHDNRLKISPIRFDFINVMGTSMAQKPNNAEKLYNVGIFNPSGWFEITNTCLIHFVQFEYDNGDKSAAPLIIEGGTFDQFNSTHGHNTQGRFSGSTQFIRLGSNTYFKNFGNGCHSEVWRYTPHIPISVNGGDYEGFYLSGIYRPNAAVIEDNAECYISGGRFGEVAGAAQQQIDGDVYWQIYNADITEFYGGGMNAERPITGNITTNIYNSHVTTFCGGPKFGDMQKQGSITLEYLQHTGTGTDTREKTIDADRTVTTVADNCTFTNYFGAGYGGTSFNKVNTRDGSSGKDHKFGVWANDDYVPYKGKYIQNKGGIATGFEYEAFVWSTGEPAGRFYVTYASFSLAQTNDVNSTLTNCKINQNFYGGGNRGKVNGKATSTLLDCQVTGNVFGAGYSASDATVDVREGGFNNKIPQINMNTGLFEEGTLSNATTYTWHQGNVTDGNSAIETVGGQNYIYTPWDLSTLGQASDVELNISGSTTVGGSVFGGGAESATHGDIEVNINNGTITGNVFGGGDQGEVTGNPQVPITKTDTDLTTAVTGSVYGGGNLAETTGNPSVTMTDGNVGYIYGGGLGSTATVTGNTGVAISGGTVSYDVFGGGSQGAVTGNVSVSLTANATVTQDVYGGGALANTNTGNPANTTTLSMTGGTVRDIYGGGLGQQAQQNAEAVAADVNGPVTVTVSGGSARYVYGCNNLYGSPKSSVEVLINGTDATQVDQEGIKTYALQAVYGGGNLAHFDPTTPGNYPTVTVNGCNTSIKDVYGGGNAAAVPYTHVIINGGDIDRVFVGGNGESGTAANVGYRNNDSAPSSGSYGSGTANATITGGTINQLFGGGNSLGTVRSSGSLNINKSTDPEACDMLIGEVYGGGNRANGAASSITIVSTGDVVAGENGHAAHPENIGKTLEGIGTVYGGANAANVTGNISLTINGGLMANVFGGNNQSGAISGTVDVNIEKTSADAKWYVGNVYGGGNLAVYAGNPTVFIKNGTVSGNVYGGGNGDPDDTDTPQVKGSTGAPSVTVGDPTNNSYQAVVLGDVYGGGNAAKVNGTDAPTVIVQKCNTQVGSVYGGGNAADVPATDVTISGGDITEVYGGGHGSLTEGDEKAANVTGNVSVAVNGGTIDKVFAGSNLNGNIGGTVSLDIYKDDDACDMIIGEVYGGGNRAAGNAGTINIGCTGTLVAGENGHAAHPENIGYTLEGIGSVYGGANQANIGTADAHSDIILNINSGMVANVFGGNNTSGTIYGTIQVNIEKNNQSCGWYVGNVYGGGNLADYTGSPAVNIKNGTVNGNVYGGGKGETALVTGNPVVTVGDLADGHSAYAAVVLGDVYGGGDAAAVSGNTSVTLQKTNSSVGRLFGGGNAAGISGNTAVNMSLGTVTTALYGGCNTTGTVGGTSAVTVTGGTIGTAFAQAPASIPGVLFGGGKGAGTSVTGMVTLNIGTKVGAVYSGSANIYGNVYGGSENGEVHAVDVNLYGNTISGNVFGGGYQTAQNLTAATTVDIMLDGTAFDMTYPGMAQIFGANDLVGTPTGHVKVHVKRTVAAAGQSANTYYLTAVYGGGNQADYTPTSDDQLQSTEVLIEGCSTTKIQDVYGGGNAAAVPASDVWIFGSDIIENVFGGGNGVLGADHAAHVGFHRQSASEKYPYEDGSGKTFVNLMGGTITNVYGGSNSNGDIRGGTNIKMPLSYPGSAVIDDTNCTLNASNIYGGGKNAPMSSGANIELGCMPDEWIDEIYAGAQAADVGGDVSLTIRSGKFGRVFGGNKDSGKLQGSITVNIEETGDCDVPIIIGELYGGGYQADYSVFGYKQDGTIQTADELKEVIRNRPENQDRPESEIDLIFNDERYKDPILNVRAFTSIGAIYGGGLQAKVLADPIIDINTVSGSHAANALAAGNTGGLVALPYPAHAAGEIGAIGNVYGGGNLANVIGNTSINIGTATTVSMESEPTHLTPASYTYNETTRLFEGVPVSGVNITGNVYGGGNAANIEGNSTITIGTVDLTDKSGTTIAGDVYGGGFGATTEITGVVTINMGSDESGTATGYATIGGDLYGGSALGTVNSTQVNMFGGTVTGSVFGGGKGQTSPSSIAARNTGDATVNIIGGTVNTAVYGGSNVNGVMTANTTVNLIGGTVGADPNGGSILDVVFGGGKGQPTIVNGDVEVNIGALEGTTPSGSAVIWGHVYGGSALGSVNGTSATSNTHTTNVNLYQGTVNGDLYGGGLGDNTPSAEVAANVYGTVTVTTKGGTAHNIFGSNNKYGAPQQAVNVQIDGGNLSGNVYGGGNLAAYGTALAPGTATVNMTGGQAVNLFGGGLGASAVVTGNTSVTLAGGTVTNNIYGGGSEANLTGNATVTVSGGQAVTVYGGGNLANVSANTTVNISGGTLSGSMFDGVRGAVFGGGYGNTTLVGGTVTVNVNGNSTITGDVYGGSAKGKVNTTNGSSRTEGAVTNVSLISGTINGSLYGGGLGDNNNEADVYGPVTVTTAGAVINNNGVQTSVSNAYNVFGGNNIKGTPKSTIAVNIGGGIISSSIYGGGNAAAYTGNPAVSMSAGMATDVFGGGLGSSAIVTGNTGVTLTGGSITNNVYGGGSEALVRGYTEVSMPQNSSVRIGNNLFGGGSEADVTGSVTVTIEDGWVTNGVYGGGALANTNIDNWDFNSETWATGKNSAQNKTTDITAVILTGGIVGDVYGGGLGQKQEDAIGTPGQPGYLPALPSREAIVYGDVTVTVDGAAFKKRDRLPDGDKDPVPTSGRVFGCNNLNGTPKGNVTVKVLSSVQLNDLDQRVPGHLDNKYDIHSVYGGGNLANYAPAAGKALSVIIDGCGETSIEKVFGGGNSAAVPATHVSILGSYAIGYAFGGGNGADKIPQRDGSWEENDGAPINGNAYIEAIGGKIGQAFSGSDTKGTVYGTATLLINGDDGWHHDTECPLIITNAYGAARGADINGDVNFTITGCGTEDGVENVFAGSYDANIRGKVTLTINSGVFKNVYGGNDHGGTIGGTITVNVEELDPNHECRPIIIQNLYGGGREATYPGEGAKYITADLGNGNYEYADYDEGKITVNIKSCTRIDNLYGGSLKAPVIGSTEVNVNMVKGDWAGRQFTLSKEYAYIPNMTIDSQTETTITATINNAIGTIGNIFGGADEGMVTGNSVVNIGTTASYGLVPVLGADITGNVYGGGNNADIRGNTYVNICAQNTNGVPTGNPVDLTSNAGYAGIKIKGSVYGGGNQGSVGTFDHLNDAKPTALTVPGTGISTVTILSDAEIGPDNMSMVTASGYPDDKGHVFGASKGYLKDPKNDPTIEYRAYVYNSNVTIGGTALIKGSVYGGSENGHVLHDTHVIIKENCQIGVGKNTTSRHPAGVWEDNYEPSNNNDLQCASWTYDEANPKSFDIYDYQDGTTKPKPATDGHSYYGNVFGGGSGVFPYAQNPYYTSISAVNPDYADGLWLRTAGVVEGNTVVDVLGGHILTSLYGGNEHTDVNGSCTVNMSGGTVGVPRTPEQIAACPVNSYVFGGGKGDQRINFNNWTNVGSATVNITGNARIYGSVFGGAEDGHVWGDVATTIGQENADNSGIKIGTTGLSKVDGNIFGGGRGFSGNALTAGVVGGNITVDIYGGYMMGSVFGGGRLASVGTYLVHPELNITEDGDGNVTSLPGDATVNPQYGALQPGTNHGNITVNIYGGTIGSSYDADELGISVGDVFAGAKGNERSYKLGLAKNTTLNIHGGVIKHNVYGGGELGSLGMITGIEEHREYKMEDGVEGAHYNFGLSWPVDIQFTPQSQEKNGIAEINITGGRIGIKGSLGGDVFGASKGKAAGVYDEAYFANVYDTHVTVDYPNGGRTATLSDITKVYEYDDEDKRDKWKLRIDDTKDFIAGSIYGGSEDGHVYHDTYITLTNGLVGHCIYGGGKGKGKYTATLLDYFDNGNPYTYNKTRSITAGKVYGNTNITMEGGHVIRNIFGGGNLGSLGIGNYAGGTDDYSLVGYGELPPYTGGAMRTAQPEGMYSVVTNQEGELWTNDLFMNSGKATVRIEGGTVGYFDGITAANMGDITSKDDLPTGNVFGGCRGLSAPNYYVSPRYKYFPEYFFGYVNETEVIIGKENDPTARPRIFGSVYGGGQDGHVRRDASVTIYNAEIGLDYSDFDDLIGNNAIASTQFINRGNVYGAGSGIGFYSITRSDTQAEETGLNYSSGSVTCNTSVTINGNTTIYQNVYGGGSMASVGPPNTGQGFDEFSTTADYPAANGNPSRSHRSTSSETVTINGGTIGNAGGLAVDYGGNVFGASRGNVMGFNLNALELTRMATSIWTNVNIAGGQIAGSVFGGGEMGLTRQDVNINVSGGNITYDVYGGGALASTNTSRKEVATGQYTYPTTTLNLTGGSMDRVYGGGLGRLHFDNNHIPNHEGANAVKAMSGNVVINLNQGVETSGKGAVVNKVFGANNFNGTPEGHITVHVFATQNKYKNSIAAADKFSHPRQGDDEDSKTYLGRLLTIASDGNGGYVTGVDGTVMAAAKTVYDKATPTDEELTVAVDNARNELFNLYDVQVIYGGGDLAAYVPTDALLDHTSYKSIVDAARSEVIIDGCEKTSINQVYGGGNAASTSGTRVVIFGTYEIEEAFGGGNGKDPYILDDGGTDYTFINPGANVGYHDYTTFQADQTVSNQFNPIDNNDALDKVARDTNYGYGSGIATTEIRGGTIHSVYGGSNQKGNIRSTALSVYEDANDDCPIHIDETYGGGKEAPMDGEIELSLDCVREMDMIFGGAKNADINNNITLSITNGTYNKVFGGNNTGGAVYGSITVNIEEKGCVPIVIGDLYGGGYLAPYSIYGYEKSGNDYVYYEVNSENQFLRQGNGFKVGNKNNGKLMPLEPGQPGASATPANDPRINIISATRIDNIYGGGYKAKMVGTPYINVNMQKGKQDVYFKNSKYVDVDENEYPAGDVTEVTTTVEGETKTNYYITLDRGTIGSIYGGGYLADVSGDTYIEIGTGQWITGWNNDRTPVYETALNTDDVTKTRNEAEITGNIFGGGDNADVTGNTNINIANGHIYFSVYGGGKIGSIGTIVNDTTQAQYKHTDVDTEFALSWPYEFEYKPGTGATNINITGGRFGFTGKDQFTDNGRYLEWQAVKGDSRKDNGDIYGGGKGIAGDRYVVAHIANVKETHITIDITPKDGKDPEDYKKSGFETDPDVFVIAGSVYGGGEDGHVNDDTDIRLINGVIGHALYGGGKGKSTYQATVLQWRGLTDDERHDRYYTSSTVGGRTVYTLKDLDQIDDQYKEDIQISSITSGKVYGNTNITMTGGHVIRNIYGGGNLGSVGIGSFAGGADDYTRYSPSKGYGEATVGNLWDGVSDDSKAFMNTGISTVNITGGTVGTADGTKDNLPTGNVFGGCRGVAVPNVPIDLTPRYIYCPEFYMGYVNDAIVTIGSQDSPNGPRLFGSVYGGGQDGHVRRETNVTIYSGEIGNIFNAANIELVGTSDSTHLQWQHRGNVLGAGSGIGMYDPDGLDDENDELGKPNLFSSAAGSVTHRTVVNIIGGTIHNSVFGGGSMASVGPPYMGHTDGGVKKDPDAPAAGYSSLARLTDGNSTMSVVNIQSKVGDDESFNNGYGGNVYGSSRGANELERARLEQDRLYATSFYNEVNIKAGSNVLGNVFGGGDAGIVYNDTWVNIANFNGATLSSATIGRDVYGGGNMADVQGNTYVNVGGGWIKKNLYGGGNMGSVGKITGTPVEHRTIKNEGMGAGALYDFGLSWPVEMQYQPGTGTTNVTITGGRFGISGKDVMVTGGEKVDNGDIYGGSKGKPAERYVEAYNANVNNTIVTIDYPSDLVYDYSTIAGYITVNNDKIIIKPDIEGIHGSVYGGGENGHVLGNTTLTLNNGLIGHGIYGGGKGKDTYESELIDYATRNTTQTTYETNVASIIAGKVYGNTNVIMNDGYVLRNIYGGGNLASVGIGNYAGGTDDYSLEGYGELPPKNGNADGPLWTNDNFMNSGICIVTINGGTIGYFNPGGNLAAFVKDDLPTGNVFGSCRGMAAPNYNDISPRYLYFPEFFYGYVNETHVTIGNANSDKTPRIFGSVYGGGQDGHVRRNSEVIINKGVIGLDYQVIEPRISESTQFIERGNVYGAGSGIGMYSYDTRQLIDPQHPESGNAIETGYNYSSGSVTGMTNIIINGGTIYQSVYGGGALASVGPPNIGESHGLGFDEFQTLDDYNRPDGLSQFNSHLSRSSNNITVNGGTIGNAYGRAAGYGGNIYGASRGNVNNLDLGPTGFLHATTIWTNVDVKNGHIFGNIFGGGQLGEVKRNTRVIIGGAEQTPGASSPVQGRSAGPQNVIQPVQPNNVQPQSGGQAQPRNSTGGSTNGASESLRNGNTNLRRM